MGSSKTSGGWEHFPHGADVGIRGLGSSLAEAFENAALAMTAVVLDPAAVEERNAVEIDCEGADNEDLFYAWLNAVIYEMATRAMVFGRFEVEIADGALKATLWGERVSQARHSPAVEIKGATYTTLAVRCEDGLWTAQCVVDV
jgi:tRNA nucleotidyltransferase (CCA-adding enzyme)